jgi:hypothetical protein
MSERKPVVGFWASLKHAFAIPAEEPLEPREREWMEKLARKVVERGLTDPALLMLESARPLNYVGAQVITFFKPVISLLFAPERCDEVAALLEKRRALKVLIQMIEQCEAEKTGQSEHHNTGK